MENSCYLVSNETETVINTFKVILNTYQHVIRTEYHKNLTIENIFERIFTYYENIIACMPGNVYWLDQNGIAVGCNKNVLNMFGFKSISEFKGLTFEEMGIAGNWLPDATQSFKKDTLEVVRTGKAKLNIEEPPISHSNGQIIYFLTSRVPLFDPEGTVIGVVGISIDITERKEMEENLRLTTRKAEAASRAKSLFLANISHDIKTPITGIIGSADYLYHAIKDPDLKLRVNSIAQSGLSLLTFMNEIIEVSRNDIQKISNTEVNVF